MICPSPGRILTTVSFIIASALSRPLMGQLTLTVNPLITCQTIDGFGASDAWSNEILLLMDSTSREKAADLLFSRRKNEDGSFQGIGLSIWRYNVGAGSAEQGDSSLIPDPYRRTECFLGPDGKYDWEKQAGSLQMIRDARERGLETLVMFSNSPPVSLTSNGRAFSGNCGNTNLPPSNVDAFAEYLCNTVRHLGETQIRVDYVSPVNEPEWDWCQRDGQEGCPYTNHLIAQLARSLNNKLIRDKLTTKIQVPESGLLVFASSGMRFKPGRQDQIDDFFKPGKDNFIGSDEQVAKQICAHSYFTEWPLWLMRSTRKKIARKTEHYNIRYWMSEYCILRETKDITGSGRDLGMKTALYVSRVIHHDLVYGNASAWCWWLGISAADFKDGLLYVGRNGKGLTDSKTLWALGNYSRFVLPGAVRVATEGRRDKEFFVSAFRNKGSDDLVIVIINMKDRKQAVEFVNLEHGTFKGWETSDKCNLAEMAAYSAGKPLYVSPESVTTFIFTKI